MPTLNNGVFAFTIGPEELSKGLRPSRRNPRNSKFLTKCEGAVGLDGILQVLSDLNEDLVDTSAITDTFPFPQLFVFTNVILVCDSTTIYELSGGSLVSKITVAPGNLWSAVDFHEFIYASNGVASVVRDPNSKVWASSSLPIASCICNFNGQVIIGSPDVEYT